MHVPECASGVDVKEQAYFTISDVWAFEFIIIWFHKFQVTSSVCMVSNSNQRLVIWDMHLHVH